MSKNIVMQELTASGYEELYPKTSASEVNFSDTTINQFLGGGEGAESALAYLSNFGKYWWRRNGNQTVYKMTTSASAASSVYFFAGKPSDGTTGTIIMCDSLSVNKQTGAFVPVNQQSVAVKFYYDDGSYFQWGSSTYVSLVSGALTTETKEKYFYENNKWYYSPYGLEFSYDKNSRYYYLGKGDGNLVSSVAETKEVTDFVYSDSDSTYPKYGASHTDGLTYWYVRSLLAAFPEMGKVEYSSYTGTGGSSTTLTLNFSRRPLCVLIVPSKFSTDYSSGLMWTNGSNAFMFWKYSSFSGSLPAVTVLSNGFGITVEVDADRLNEGNVTYNVFAITQ